MESVPVTDRISGPLMVRDLNVDVIPFLSLNMGRNPSPSMVVFIS